MSMQPMNPKKTTQPTPFLERVALDLDQIDAALAATDDGAAYLDAVTEAAYAIRRVLPFVTRTISEAQRTVQNQADALQTATGLSQQAVGKVGYASPADRQSALDSAAEKTKAAFWTAALDAAAAAKNDPALKLAEDAREAIDAAKAAMQIARAKFGAPLALRARIDADAFARLALVRDELDGQKPTELLTLWNTYAAVQDEDMLDLLALALVAPLREYRDKPRLIDRHRIAGNLEHEQKALNELNKLVAGRREAKFPPSFVEAEAALARLSALWNTIFTRPTDRVRRELDATDSTWLRRAASAPVPR